MSKLIRMTDEYIKDCLSEFEKSLRNNKWADGKFSFSKTLTVDRKAVIYFTAEAWAKTAALLNAFDKEVAWHGVAYRSEDETKDEYFITDIVVYPQEVTGASVEMDTESYTKWLIENDGDERFDNIHMQAHSHVRMPTSPSSVDLNHQEEILNMLGDDDFYIFMIWNKSFDREVKIYDMKKNILFGNSDVSIKLTGGTEDLDSFIKSSKEMVKDKSYNYKKDKYDNKHTEPYDPLPQLRTMYGGSESKDKPTTKTKTKVTGEILGQQGMLEVSNAGNYYESCWRDC